MIQLDIKPLSVNKAWKGKRFKTNDYKRYDRDCFTLLPKAVEVPQGDLKLTLVFGFSSKASDADNPVKCFVDILQKKYGFNDNKIYEYSIKKVDVKKGQEFIQFHFEQLK